MIYQEQKAVDHNWCKLLMSGFTADPLLVTKYALKDKRTIDKLRVIGSPLVVAFTRGIYEAEDTVLEMYEAAFYTKFIPRLGAGVSVQANAGGVQIIGAAGKVFELSEYVSDPDKSAFGAGGVTNFAKGCEVIGCEKSVENSEKGNVFMVTVAIKEIEWGQSGLGGGFSLAR
jgi:hypothetical protein